MDLAVGCRSLLCSGSVRGAIKRDGRPKRLWDNSNGRGETSGKTPVQVWSMAGFFKGACGEAICGSERGVDVDSVVGLRRFWSGGHHESVASKRAEVDHPGEGEG